MAPSRRPIKALFYAINGTGLGHLSRLLAIARELRDLCDAAGTRADLQFLTTSDASQIADEFAVYKIPSKSAVARTDASPSAFAAAAKLVASNVAAAVRPDLLVVDTVPEGSFREILFLRDYARKLVFVDRRKDLRRAASAIHQSHLALYDLILVPDDPHAVDAYPAPAEIAARRRFVGRVHGFCPAQAWDSARVRAHFAIDDARRVVYVSAGGGGDPRADEALRGLVCTLAADPGLLLLVGYGPLHRGDRVYRANVIPLDMDRAWRIFPGLDLAICAAGYNTYEELLAARVPALFFAQAKGMDRQDLRITHGLSHGWHGHLESLDSVHVRAQVTEWLDGPSRERAVSALAKRPVPSGALRCAVALLDAHAAIDGSAESRELSHVVGAIRQTWRRVGAPSWRPLSGIAVDWMLAKWPREQADAFAAACATDDPSRAWTEQASALIDLAAGVARSTGALGWDRDRTRRLLRAYGGAGWSHPQLGQRLVDVLERAHARLAPRELDRWLDGVIATTPRQAVPDALDDALCLLSPGDLDQARERQQSTGER